MNLTDKLTVDPWLSGLIGVEACKLEADAEFFAAAKISSSSMLRDLRNKMEADVFIQAKSACDLTPKTALLEDLGFRFVDVNVLFEKPTGGPVPEVGEGVAVRFACPGDREAAMKLGGSSFYHSRFYHDSFISRETADRIKAEWTGNFFSGLRGESMAVAEADGRFAGFLLLLERKETVAIDLIAVASEFRRRGVAGAMMAFLEKERGNGRRYIVGTQAANVRSIRCYEKYGFRAREASCMFHYSRRGGVAP